MSHFDPFWGFGTSPKTAVSVGDCMPNIGVMFNWDIYQPLLLFNHWDMFNLNCCLIRAVPFKYHIITIGGVPPKRS